MILLADQVFDAPHLNYGRLSPLLIVFGVALVGVLVEAFAPRRLRYAIQTVLTLAGLVAALVAVVFVSQGVSSHHGGVSRGSLEAVGAIAVDGPSLFLWGTLLIFGLISVLLVAERHLEGGLTAFAGQAAALPGTDAEREAASRGVEHTEVFPLVMFALGG